VIEPSSHRRHRRRRRRPPTGLIALVAAAIVFAVGVALGKSLEDNPQPNLTVTTTKTIVP
jgi:drug/metabolite transporter (DMT)-like permease